MPAYNWRFGAMRAGTASRNVCGGTARTAPSRYDVVGNAGESAVD